MGFVPFLPQSGRHGGSQGVAVGSVVDVSNWNNRRTGLSDGDWIRDTGTGLTYRYDATGDQTIPPWLYSASGLTHVNSVVGDESEAALTTAGWTPTEASSGTLTTNVGTPPTIEFDTRSANANTAYMYITHGATDGDILYFCGWVKSLAPSQATGRGDQCVWFDEENLKYRVIFNIDIVSGDKGRWTLGDGSGYSGSTVPVSFTTERWLEMWWMGNHDGSYIQIDRDPVLFGQADASGLNEDGTGDRFFIGSPTGQSYAYMSARDFSIYRFTPT